MSTSAHPPADTTAAHAMLTVRVHALRAEAADVVSLELRSVDGESLPPFEPGSHIDVEVPLGPERDAATVLRQYSLSNHCRERERYVIGVGRDARSRGGSEALHRHVRAGDLLRIGAPRNHFPLHEHAPHSVLVAGGIGITPMLAMARRLADTGQPWTLYYCVRSPARAAFIEPLLALAPLGSNGRVVTVFDGVPGVKRLDLDEVVREAPAGAHFYCCGPAAMLTAFQQATAGCGDERVHVEWFAAPPPSAPAVDAPGAGSFIVRLQRTGCSFQVPPEKTILAVLLDHGIDVDHSCREGLCGTCETRVLSGVPDHRDPILAGRKNPPLNTVMVCVSRCAGPELVLDL